MKIFRFRVLLDHSTETFRDIEIKSSSSFNDLHDIIIKAFEFSGMEMASFYESNEDWDKGDEISLMELFSDDVVDDPVRSMANTTIHDVVSETGDKLLYLYDFLRMWIFYVELIAIEDSEARDQEAIVVLLVGTSPSETSKEDAGPMPVDSIDDEFSESADYSFDEEDGGYETFEDSLDF